MGHSQNTVTNMFMHFKIRKQKSRFDQKNPSFYSYGIPLLLTFALNSFCYVLMQGSVRQKQN